MGLIFSQKSIYSDILELHYFNPLFAGVKQLIGRFCPKCSRTVLADKRGRKKIRRSCQKCKANLNYYCLKCNNKYKTYSSIYQHITTKCECTTQYSCCLCGFTTRSKHRLRRHTECFHSKQNTPAACGKCGRQYKNIYSLKTHQQHCGVEPRFFCNFCSYKTGQKGNLVRHVKWHESNASATLPEVDEYDENTGLKVRGNLKIRM